MMQSYYYHIILDLNLIIFHLNVAVEYDAYRTKGSGDKRPALQMLLQRRMELMYDILLLNALVLQLLSCLLMIDTDDSSH